MEWVAGKLAGNSGVNEQRLGPRWQRVDPVSWQLLLSGLYFLLLRPRGCVYRL